MMKLKLRLKSDSDPLQRKSDGTLKNPNSSCMNLKGYI